MSLPLPGRELVIFEPRNSNQFKSTHANRKKNEFTGSLGPFFFFFFFGKPSNLRINLSLFWLYNL